MNAQGLINNVKKIEYKKVTPSLYQKARANKLFVTSFWILFGFIFIGGVVTANTFISNTGDSTFSSNILMDDGTNITATNLNVTNNSVFSGNITISLNNRITLSGDSSKWHYLNGSSIDFNLMTTDAKPFLGWYDLYTDPNDRELVAWVGAHQSNSDGDPHDHWEVETWDTDIGFVQGKLIVSYNTTRADSFVQVTNVGKFKLGASVDIQFANGEEIQSGGATNGLILLGGNQTTYGLKVKNVSNMVELVGFGADEIRISSDLNVFNNHIYLNDTNNPLIEIERDDTATDATLAFTTGAIRRWSLMLDNDGTNDLYIRNNNAGKMAVTINDSLSLNINNGNLTLMDEIKFRFGQTIDNIIDGWITITGGLNVTGGDITTNGSIILTNPSASNAMTIDQNGDAGASTSVGGALLIKNSGNVGSGLTIFSSLGSTVSGHLMNLRTNNLEFDKNILFLDYMGSVAALGINNKGNGSLNPALSISSINNDSSAVWVTGNESDKGTVKITHKYPGTSDIDSAALSLELQGVGTASKGIFIDSSDGGTTGDLVHIKNNNVETFIIKSSGALEMGNGTSQVNITLTSPDGSESCCGVDNSDNFVCSAGAC